MNGYPCPLCNKEKQRQIHEKEYKQKLIDKNIPIILDDKYISHSEKIYHICLRCNNRWKSSPAYVLKNKYPCPKCAKIETVKIRTKTQTEFKNEIYKIFGDSISIIGNYNGAKSIIDVHCNVCNHNWTPLAENLLSKHGCPRCRDIETGNRCRKTIEQYKNEICDLYKDVIVISNEYQNAYTPILHQCTLCQYMYYQTPSNVLNGYGKCPLCNKCYEISENEFIELLHRNGKQIKLLSPYTSKKDNIECQCLICNYVWTSIAYSLLNTVLNCPKCASSKGEKFVQTYLDKHNISYIHQFKFNDLLGVGNGHLSYDFYLPHYNLLIEYQGVQHERPIEYFGGIKKFVIQKIHDTRKRKYAHNHNIKLLEIWYYEIDKIEEILKQSLNNLKSESVETVIPA